jgi:hypothetical protein
VINTGSVDGKALREAIPRASADLRRVGIDLQCRAAAELRYDARPRQSDRWLDEAGYILLGLGDAGDDLFGTK